MQTILCPICGSENEAGTTICYNCSSPLQEEPSCGDTTLTLTELRSKREILLDTPGIIGREMGDIAPDFFGANEYVSSTHCEIQYKDGAWLVEDLQSSNGTFVDNVKLAPHTPMFLHDGGMLRIANIGFRIAITAVEVPETPVEEVPETPAEPAAIEWEIVCPCCRKHYKVNGPDDRIAECDRCDDDVDKFEIANVAPRQKLPV